MVEGVGEGQARMEERRRALENALHDGQDPKACVRARAKHRCILSCLFFFLLPLKLLFLLFIFLFILTLRDAVHTYQQICSAPEATLGSLEQSPAGQCKATPQPAEYIGVVFLCTFRKGGINVKKWMKKD